MKKLSDKETDDFCLKIVELLDGIRVSDALYIVKERCPQAIETGHLIDTNSDSFIAMKEMTKKHYSSLAKS